MDGAPVACVDQPKALGTKNAPYAATAEINPMAGAASFGLKILESIPKVEPLAAPEVTNKINAMIKNAIKLCWFIKKITPKVAPIITKIDQKLTRAPPYLSAAHPPMGRERAPTRGPKKAYCKGLRPEN